MTPVVSNVNARLAPSAQLLPAFFMLLLAASGCGVRPAPVEDAPSDPVVELQAEAEAFRAGQALPADAIGYVRRLADAAIRAGLARDEESAKKALVARYANEPLGVFVLGAWFDAFEGTPDARLELARSLLAELPSTSVGAAALDEELDALALLPDAALQRCSDVIAAGADTRLVRVAMFRRMEFFSASRNYAAAGVDALRLWGLFPDEVQTLHLQTKLLGVLERAGFLLERGMLARSGNPKPVTDWLAAGLVSVFDKTDDGMPAGERACLQAYLDAAPARIAFDCQSGAAPDGCEQALWAARLALLEGARGDGIDCRNAYAAALEAALGDSQPPHETGRLLALANMAVTDQLEETSKLWQYAKSRAGMRAQPWAGKTPLLVDSLVQKHVRLTDLLNEAAVRAALPPEKVAEAFELNIAFLKSLNHDAAVTAAYEGFLARLPEFPKAPEYCFRLADTYSATGSDGKAAEILLQLVKAFPDSPEASRASAQAGCLMLKSKAYNGAYLQFSRALAQYPESEYAATATFGLAMCEHALDQQEAAEQRLQGFVHQHPQNALAPKSLLLMGSWQLAEQRYEEAANLFQAVVERYPNSSEVQACQDYLKKIQEFIDSAEVEEKQASVAIGGTS